MGWLAKSPEDRFPSFHEVLDHLGLGAEPAVPRAVALWVYKCNSRSPVGGHWKDFFPGASPGRGGALTVSTVLPAGKPSVSTCRLAITYWLGKPMKRLPGGCVGWSNCAARGPTSRSYCKPCSGSPHPSLCWTVKKKSPALAAGIAFQPAKVGTLFATFPEEARELRRICCVPGQTS